MELRVWYRQYTIMRIAEGKDEPILGELMQEIGDLWVFQITPALIHRWVARTDYAHYKALGEFVSWLDIQDGKGEFKTVPKTVPNDELEYLFRRLSDAGRGNLLSIRV